MLRLPAHAHVFLDEVGIDPAWREKDIEWLNAGIAAGVLSLRKMKEQLSLLPAADPERGMPDRSILVDRMARLDAGRAPTNAPP